MTTEQTASSVDQITPLDLAGELMLQLAKSNPLPLREEDRALLEGTTTFRFGPDKSRIGWMVGEGPLVLLMHGYGGRGVQMAAIAHTLAKQGYRCAFGDSGGHGDSRTERVGFHSLIADCAALQSAFAEDVNTWIGHSAGGLAMMRARRLLGVRATRYVCIAAPLYPYVPLESMSQIPGVGDEALDFVKAVLSDQFQTNWSTLIGGCAYAPDEGTPLLAIYDRDDPRVHHTDADRISSLWPGTQVLITSGYGHNRILQAPELLSAISEYVSDA